MGDSVPSGGSKVLRPVPRPDVSDVSDVSSPACFPEQVLPPLFQKHGHSFAAAVAGSPTIAFSAILASFSASLGPHWKVDGRGMIRAALLWLATVAPSGSAKTPMAKPILSWLHEEDIRLRDEFRDALRKWKSKSKKGDDRLPEEPPPRRQRVAITDLTPEGLGNALSVSPEGLLVHSDELAQLLASLDAATGRPGKGRAFFLSLWSGTRHSESRKVAEESDVDEPFAIIYGGVQPSVLRGLGLENGDGLAGRFLWSAPIIEVGGLGQRISADVQAEWDWMLNCARRGRWSEPHKLAEDAVALVDREIREWKQTAVDLDKDGRGLLSSMYGKAGDHLLRITALLHGMDALDAAWAENPRPKALGAFGVVPRSTVERARVLVEYFLEQGSQVVDQIVTPLPDLGKLSGSDQRLLDALRRIVPPGGDRIETATTWQQLLDEHEIALSSRSTGWALKRMSKLTLGPIRVEQRTRGEERGWRVSHAGETSGTSGTSGISLSGEG